MDRVRCDQVPPRQALVRVAPVGIDGFKNGLAACQPEALELGLAVAVANIIKHWNDVPEEAQPQ